MEIYREMVYQMDIYNVINSSPVLYHWPSD